MTETGSTVGWRPWALERLRGNFKLTDADAAALLAVVEAAQEIEGQPLNHVRHSSLLRLSKALAALRSQASDEGDT